MDKSLKVPKGKQEAANRKRTDNTKTKKSENRRTNNDIQNTTKN